MDILFLVSLPVFFSHISFSGQSFHKDYIKPASTKSVCGVFVILVFLNHFRGYSSLPDAGIYSLVSRLMGQLIVAPFLFYSGYGVMYSIREKGLAYLQSFPIRRILRTWFHFAIAVTIYLVAGMAAGRAFTPLQLLYAYLGLSSIGNSNWFIWTVLWLYILTYCVARISGNSHFLFLGILSVLTFVYMYCMEQILPQYFYLSYQ